MSSLGSLPGVFPPASVPIESPVAAVGNPTGIAIPEHHWMLIVVRLNVPESNQHISLETVKALEDAGSYETARIARHLLWPRRRWYRLWRLSIDERALRLVLQGEPLGSNLADEVERLEQMRVQLRRWKHDDPKDPIGTGRTW